MTKLDAAQRSCIICKQCLPAANMLRLIVDSQGQVWPDLLHKMDGRGAYLCMSEQCLSSCSDKRLQVLKRDFTIVLPQWEVVRERMIDVLDRHLERSFSRVRRSAATGRDAVMHRLWNNAPVLLLLATDAGEAITRQVQDAAEKREQAGLTYTLMLVVDRNWLGRMLGRDQVAVAALDSSAMIEKLKQYCVWFGRMKVSG
ncbi:MAG: DUF448 domain-containing protein [Mariprofundus sp.]|nr:DUF448 domain-containing protein [Mariprofundus sp.]